MNILRGTFRLSIFVALAVTGYLVWQAYAKGAEQYASAYELWATTKCGHKLLDRDTSHLENDFGLIDLGKAGCIDRQFLATKEEIRAAWARSGPDLTQRDFVIKYGLQDAWVGGILAFIATNLLGLVFLGVRRSYRWVVAGYGS